MVRNLFHGSMLLLLIAFLVGCQSINNIKLRSYITEKDRVDQEISGNAGFMEGVPADFKPEPVKSTRKIYVLEINKEIKRTPYDADLPLPNSGSFQQEFESSSQIQINEIPSFDFPDFEAIEVQEEAPSSEPPQYIDYKVEKDDTLQKISKKFYDSYSRWPRIYEANKILIKNPDKIKPGITIKVPIN